MTQQAARRRVPPWVTNTLSPPPLHATASPPSSAQVATERWTVSRRGHRKYIRTTKKCPTQILHPFLDRDPQNPKSLFAFVSLLFGFFTSALMSSPPSPSPPLRPCAHTHTGDQRAPRAHQAYVNVATVPSRVLLPASGPVLHAARRLFAQRGGRLRWRSH